MKLLIRRGVLCAAVLAVSGSLILSPRPLYAQGEPATAVALPAAPPPVVRHLARGVDLIQETLYFGKTADPHIVTVFKVDPRVPGVRVEAGLGQDQVWGSDATFGREIVSKIVTRHKAVAGVNAGFFPFKGDPLGMHIQAGDLVSEPLKDNKTSFYVLKDGLTGFATFEFAGSVTMPNGQTLAIDALNKQPSKEGNELLLFSPIFFPQTLPAAGRFEVVLSGVSSPIKPNKTYTGTVVSVGEGGKSKLGADTVVLSGGGSDADLLRASATPGAKLSFRLDVTSNDNTAVNPADIAFAVSGSPIMLRDGKGLVRLKRNETGTFNSIEHPRTAIGRTADGVLLIATVDGRQKSFSQGASIPELIKVLQNLGATDAINLDGGGSSDAVAWDDVANSPSDGSERSVADMLLVYADDLPATPLAKPAKPAGPDHILTVGETFDFGAESGLGGDENTVWGTKGSKGTRNLPGFVSQTGVFRAMRPGTATVSVTRGARSRHYEFQVTVQGAKAAEAEFTAALTLTPDPDAPNSRAILTAKIANADGDPLANEPVAIAVTGGKAGVESTTTNRQGTIRVTITWDSGAAVRSVRITSPQKRFRDSDPVSAPAGTAH